MPEHTHQPIAILGSGAWGTALALYLSRLGQTVYLWSIETPQVNAMRVERTNNKYLPGFPFPSTLHPEADLEKAISGVEDILIVVPSVGFRDTLVAVKPFLKPQHRFISATKGMDMDLGCLLHETAHTILPKSTPYAVLSGPSFAKEVASGLPTSVVIASWDSAYAKLLKTRFHTPLFRIELSEDVIGVEMGAVVKNTMAIAAGMSDGMELGANARSAMITRGLNEMISLGMALGADRKTFEGLSGLGDLILTCTDDLSRNRRFGLALGRGMSKDQAEKEIGHVVEGKRNTELLVQLAKKHKIAMPICEAVHAILQNEIAPTEGMEKIWES